MHVIRLLNYQCECVGSKIFTFFVNHDENIDSTVKTFKIVKRECSAIGTLLLRDRKIGVTHTFANPDTDF